jgi:hypothetical protein
MYIPVRCIRQDGKQKLAYQEYAKKAGSTWLD